jgi:hypothetical protein
MEKIMRRGKFFIIENGQKREVSKEVWESGGGDKPLRTTMFTRNESLTPPMKWQHKGESWKT